MFVKVYKRITRINSISKINMEKEEINRSRKTHHLIFCSIASLQLSILTFKQLILN